MRILTAPNSIEIQDNEISVFLAGGIQKTAEWQNEVIAALQQEFADKPLVVMNPRRKDFPIHDPTASFTQIKWEYDALEIADIFSMYFAGYTASDQPICQFEYGKHLERRKANNDLERLIVTSEPSYSRNQDVIIQTGLVSKDIQVGTSLDDHIKMLMSVIKTNLISSKLI